jgi:hypothetical protein
MKQCLARAPGSGLGLGLVGLLALSPRSPPARTATSSGCCSCSSAPSASPRPSSQQQPAAGSHQPPATCEIGGGNTRPPCPSHKPQDTYYAAPPYLSGWSPTLLWATISFPERLPEGPPKGLKTDEQKFRSLRAPDIRVQAPVMPIRAPCSIIAHFGADRAEITEIRDQRSGRSGRPPGELYPAARTRTRTPDPSGHSASGRMAHDTPY